MDDRRARFLEQLRETFRAEAAEHIEAMSAGLVALERASESERAPLVETVFREAHSLKGAARAVGFIRAEALCVELESLFAAAKGEGLHLTAEHLDGAHARLAILAVVCADPAGEAPTVRPSAPVAAPAPVPAPSAPAPVTSAPVAAGEAAAAPVPAPSAPVAAGVTSAPAPVTSAPAPAPSAPTPAAATGTASAEPAPAPAAAPALRPAVNADTVRVSVPRLTALMRDAEQLVGSRVSALSLAADLGRLADAMAEGRDNAQDGDHVQALRALAASAARDAQALKATTDLVLEGARSVLLLPCSSLLGTFAPMAREMARQNGKDVELRVAGEDIEVDRRVLDELKDPLIHLLRNAVDHGIERPEIRRDLGKPERASIIVTVTAAQNNRVQVSVADDGAGIDRARVLDAAARLGLDAPASLADGAGLDATALIFESGVSSSPVVTDLSGRGLGLAIVREKVHKLNGTVGVTSIPGRGTTFLLEVPTSLSNFRGVTVGVAGRTVIIPSAAVTRVFRVRAEAITTVDGRPSVTMDGRAILVAPLHDLLELPAPDQRSLPPIRSVVGLQAGDRRVALLVDEVRGEQDVILKHLGPLLMHVPTVAGVSMGARGEIVPVLDAADLVDRAFGGQRGARRDADPVPATRGARRLLVADDSITSRSLLRSLLAGEGYAVTTAVDGEEALSRLHTEPFDLVVSDVDMPRMTGLELTVAIRSDSLLAALPVILVTSLATPADRVRGLDAGANAYVVKSNFDSGSLLDIVRRFL